MYYSGDYQCRSVSVAASCLPRPPHPTTTTAAAAATTPLSPRPPPPTRVSQSLRSPEAAPGRRQDPCFHRYTGHRSSSQTSARAVQRSLGRAELGAACKLKAPHRFSGTTPHLRTQPPSFHRASQESSRRAATRVPLPTTLCTATLCPATQFNRGMFDILIATDEAVARSEAAAASTSTGEGPGGEAAEVDDKGAEDDDEEDPEAAAAAAKARAQQQRKRRRTASSGPEGKGGLAKDADYGVSRVRVRWWEVVSLSLSVCVRVSSLPSPPLPESLPTSPSSGVPTGRRFSRRHDGR